MSPAVLTFFRPARRSVEEEPRDDTDPPPVPPLWPLIILGMILILVAIQLTLQL